MTTTRHPVTKMMFIYLGFIGSLILLAPMCSCRTQRGFNRTADNHKDWLSEKCSEEFPIDTSVQSNTDTTHADNKDYSKTIDSLRSIAENALNQVKVDTIYSEKDCNELLQSQAKTITSLSKALDALRSEYKPCKPSYITKTITYTVESKSKLYTLENKNEKLQKELDRSKIWNKVLMGIALICGVVIFIRRR